MQNSITSFAARRERGQEPKWPHRSFDLVIHVSRELKLLFKELPSSEGQKTIIDSIFKSLHLAFAKTDSGPLDSLSCLL